MTIISPIITNDAKGNFRPTYPVGHPHGSNQAVQHKLYKFHAPVVIQIDVASAENAGCLFYQTPSYSVLCAQPIPQQCILGAYIISTGTPLWISPAFARTADGNIRSSITLDPSQSSGQRAVSIPHRQAPDPTPSHEAGDLPPLIRHSFHTEPWTSNIKVLGHMPVSTHAFIQHYEAYHGQPDFLWFKRICVDPLFITTEIIIQETQRIIERLMQVKSVWYASTTTPYAAVMQWYTSAETSGKIWMNNNQDSIKIPTSSSLTELFGSSLLPSYQRQDRTHITRQPPAEVEDAILRKNTEYHFTWNEYNAAYIRVTRDNETQARTKSISSETSTNEHILQILTSVIQAHDPDRNPHKDQPPTSSSVTPNIQPAASSDARSSDQPMPSDAARGDSRPLPKGASKAQVRRQLKAIDADRDARSDRDRSSSPSQITQPSQRSRSPIPRRRSSSERVKLRPRVELTPALPASKTSKRQPYYQSEIQDPVYSATRTDIVQCNTCGESHNPGTVWCLSCQKWIYPIDDPEVQEHWRRTNAAYISKKYQIQVKLNTSLRGGRSETGQFAWDARRSLKRAQKQGYPTIHNRWKCDPIYRASMEQIGRTEAQILEMDVEARRPTQRQNVAVGTRQIKWGRNYQVKQTIQSTDTQETQSVRSHQDFSAAAHHAAKENIRTLQALCEQQHDTVVESLRHGTVYCSQCNCIIRPDHYMTSCITCHPGWRLCYKCTISRRECLTIPFEQWHQDDEDDDDLVET